MNENLNLALNNFVADLRGVFNDTDPIIKIIKDNKTNLKKTLVEFKEHYNNKIKTIYEKNLAAFKSDLPKYKNDLNKKIIETIEASPLYAKIPSGFKSTIVKKFAETVTGIILSFNSTNFGKTGSLKQLKKELHYLLRLK